MTPTDQRALFDDGADPAPELAGGAPASSSPRVECDRCGFDRFVDVRIHAGRSRRRDCARCGRTLGFPVWYGQASEAEPARRSLS
jgi:hypothetical protein